MDYKGNLIEIKNVKIYDLEESIIASGYPVVNNIEESEFSFERVQRLCKQSTNSGHSNFLTGILCSFDLLASQYFLIQFQRYHFAQIVSSQSKMHNITKGLANYNENVEPFIIEHINLLINKYNKEPTSENFHKIISNVPMGFRLWMRISTNYMQLKNMYLQRKNHKLNDWKEFCEFIKSLPYMEFIL